VNLYHALKNFPGHSRQLTCRGLLFTNYDCPQATRKESFFIEQSHICYVLSGRRTFHKMGKSWELSEGRCAFVKTGTHIAEKQGDEGWCVMVFFMPDEFLVKLANDIRGQVHNPVSQKDSEEHVLFLDVNEISRSFFLSMLPYFSQDPPPPENLVELKFKELLLSLLSNKENAHFLYYLLRLSENRKSSLAEIMENNFTFNLSLEEYARLACKTVPTFKREFKKAFNDSPAKWVMKRRIDLAGNLLLNSNKSVGEICLDCGFENPTHCSRVFKAQTGMSPTDFRKGSR
jgi:AraC family transcriptional regulator, exoenzyme S synthesis regulatory protein ExsA